jgi:hypothetical protein
MALGACKRFEPTLAQMTKFHDDVDEYTKAQGSIRLVDSDLTTSVTPL